MNTIRNNIRRNKISLIFAPILMLVALFLVGCYPNKTLQTMESTETNQDNQDETVSVPDTYYSPYGFSLVYNPADFTVSDCGEETVEFTFYNEETEIGVVAISFYDNMEPEEALIQTTKYWTDDLKLIKSSEQPLPGTDNRVSLCREYSGEIDNIGLEKTAFAAEINGGTILFDITKKKYGNVELEKQCSNGISSLISSVKYSQKR